MTSNERDPAGNGLPLELRELRYFAVLAEELHFGRAAERLHISQSPLSQAIAQLERKLGTRLLDRSSRHVQLTAAGSVLLHHARRLLREAGDAVDATRRAGSGETGSLKLAVGPVSREAILPGLRHALDERLPSLTIEVVELGGDDVVEAVLRGGADAGLMLTPPSGDDVQAVPLRRDSAVAIVRRGHPLSSHEQVTLAELAKHTLVLWPHDIPRGAHDLVLALFHGHMPASLRVTDRHSGAAWDAMHADGFAVVPASSAVGGDFVAVPIHDADVDFTMSLIWSDATPPAVLPALLDAADAAADENDWLAPAPATSDGRGATAARPLRLSRG
ncbi:MAG TPA: LysR family transcriptional regulator [Gaiellaceae bacterium]|nr:LysR family transcriptional regulator [Gaiellaceae bacterium]